MEKWALHVTMSWGLTFRKMRCKGWTRKLLEREGPVSEVGGIQEEALVAGQGQYVPL